MMSLSEDASKRIVIFSIDDLKAKGGEKDTRLSQMGLWEKNVKEFLNQKRLKQINR